MITLQSVPHYEAIGREAVELWDDSGYIGILFPSKEGIKIISDRLGGNPLCRVVPGKTDGVPSVLIDFKKTV